MAELVEELTDVSRPGDGNRMKRKKIGRKHLAYTSSRAKTVKLADLIDNCRDIVKHDPKFARVYLAEMQILLDVLGEGNAWLYKRAQKMVAIACPVQTREGVGHSKGAPPRWARVQSARVSAVFR